MSLRIDKFVWSVRLSKTRSIATDLISKGKIRLNGESIKPSKEVKVGDIINFQRNTATFSYKVIQLLSNRVGAKLVADYLIDITAPIEVEKYKAYQASQSVYRELGSGKPSKKDRRDISDFLGDWFDED